MHSRREGLGKRLETLAKAAALATALETGAGAIGDKALANVPRVERKEQKIPASILEEITKFESQKVSLSEEEILDQLKRNDVEDQARIFNIDVPEGERFWIDEHTWFGKRLKDIAKSGPAGGLNVVRIDFTRSGEDLGLMSYWGNYRALFINRTPSSEQRRDMMESFLSLSLARFVRNTEMIALWKQRGKLGENAYNKKRRERGSYYDALDRGKPRFDSFAPESFKQHEKRLLGEAKTYRLDSARRFVLDTFGLPHEIFHYKFATQLFQPGYRGPDASELIFAALKSKRDRFPGEQGAYQHYNLALEIQLIAGWNINVSDDELKRVSKNLARSFDITRRDEHPEIDTKELDPHERLRLILRSYVDEYLARIYAGALGSTPINVYRALSKVGRAHAHISRYQKPIRQGYHEPTEEELSLIRRMEYNGKSMLPEAQSMP